MLPSPPSKLLETIRYAWSRDCSAQELARRVQENDALSTVLLQFVSNKQSAGSEITTAARATLLLGSKSVGSVAAWVAAANAINRAEIDPDAISSLYEDALRRSAAMMILARNTGAITEEHAAAIGMCLELGKVDLICQDSTRVIWLDGLRSSSGESRTYKEKEYLGANHIQGFKSVSRRWGLPTEISGPVLAHHDEGADMASDMARCADLMAEVYTSSEPAEALSIAKVVLKERLDIEPDLVYGMISALSERVVEAGWLLGMPAPEQPALETILSQHDDNFDEMSREQLMKLIDGHRREAKQAKEQIEELKGRLMTLRGEDSLTGLLNRQRYLERLQREIDQAAGRPGALSLLLLDIDMLDEQNACHGMATGDVILQSVGKMIEKVCDERDFGARVGGDEFAVVLWNRNTPKARLAAERLRAAVEMAKVDHKGKRARISATLVGICIDDIDNPTAESLHAKAQKELERIKGSNRTGWAA
jgi:diguanylate cyclase (GGDEF)-like protein